MGNGTQTAKISGHTQETESFGFTVLLACWGKGRILAFLSTKESYPV